MLQFTCPSSLAHLLKANKALGLGAGLDVLINNPGQVPEALQVSRSAEPRRKRRCGPAPAWFMSAIAPGGRVCGSARAVSYLSNSGPLLKLVSCRAAAGWLLCSLLLLLFCCSTAALCCTLLRSAAGA